MTAEGKDERPMSLGKRAGTQTSPLCTSSLVSGSVEEGVDIGGGLAIGAKDQSTDRRVGSQGREDRADGRSHSAVVIVVEAPGGCLIFPGNHPCTLSHSPAPGHERSVGHVG